MLKRKPPSSVNELLGKRLHRLVVLEYAGAQYEAAYSGSKWQYYMKCLCDCGREVSINARALRRQKSCGCAPIKASIDSPKLNFRTS